MTAYDELGRRVSETNQDGIITRFGFDALGRLVAVTNDYQSAVASPFVTTYGYDEAGNQVSQTDANGHTTTFAYDKLGRRIRRTLPENQFEQFFYDAAGNMTIHTNFDGKITHLAYDVLNRLTQKIPDPSFGARTLSFTYTTTGQRNTMVDQSCRVDASTSQVIPTQYVYDPQHLLVKKKASNGGRFSYDVVNYEYDLAGNVAHIFTMTGDGTAYGFTDVLYQSDALNRLTNVVNQSQLQQGPAVA